MMGADALLKEVEERRAKALDALEAEYAAKRDEVKKRTDEQVAWVSDSTNKEAVAQAQKESTKVEGAAKLQAKKTLFDATEKQLENNISLLRQELADFAISPAYRDLLGKMAHYASRRLGGKISVVCRKSDESALKAAGAKIISADLNSIGGFKAENSERTLELDLTFEEVLRSREDEVRAAILGKE
jgi:V/A-type H+/Na+-transporting ATPase subunit E